MGTLAAGIKDIFSNAKTTGTNVMLSGNDGTPDGHITMANLANVLRVSKTVGYISSYASSNDANDFCGEALFGMTDPETRNIPVSIYGFLLNFDCGTDSYPNFGVQIWFQAIQVAKVYYRVFWNGWQQWTELQIANNS